MRNEDNMQYMQAHKLIYITCNVLYTVDDDYDDSDMVNILAVTILIKAWILNYLHLIGKIKVGKRRVLIVTYRYLMNNVFSLNICIANEP